MNSQISFEELMKIYQERFRIRNIKQNKSIKDDIPRLEEDKKRWENKQRSLRSKYFNACSFTQKYYVDQYKLLMIMSPITLNKQNKIIREERKKFPMNYFENTTTLQQLDQLEMKLFKQGRQLIYESH